MSFTPTNIHFHKGTAGTADLEDDGSEHTLNGEHFDLEMHIVNLNHNTNTKKKFLAAVIGILFRVSPHEDEHHSRSFADIFFGKLFNKEECDFNTEFFQHLNMNERYVYKGSLTTPPYAETLLWNVLPNIVTISKSTYDLFGGVDGNKEIEKEYNDYVNYGEVVYFGGENRMP